MPLRALRAGPQLAGLEVDGLQGAVCDLRPGDGVRGQLRTGDGVGRGLLAGDRALLQLRRADRVLRQHEPARGLAERRRVASTVAGQGVWRNTATFGLGVWPAAPRRVRHTATHARRAVLAQR